LVLTTVSHGIKVLLQKILHGGAVCVGRIVFTLAFGGDFNRLALVSRLCGGTLTYVK
jgi:glycerol dehydrogenase-like iron-containing ADH family enzyme